MEKNKKSRLIIIRALGVLFTLVTIYIVATSVTKEKPSDFWAKFRITPDFNLYEAKGTWLNSDGEKIILKRFEKKVTVFSFIYLHCRSFCPRIVNDMIRLRKKLGDDKDKVNFVFFLFDDVTSKPTSINKFYKQYGLDKKTWTVLTAKPKILKQLTEKFKLRYGVLKKKEPEYMHSNLIAAARQDGKV